MNRKEIFFKDKENCTIPFTHIMEDIPNLSLQAIDDLYGAADVLSIRNAVTHHRILLSLAVAGMLITFLFLLYDEAELYGLIFACGAMILTLFVIYQISDRLECHRKYLEYRVLAETLRVQFFISFAGVNKSVVEILPWFISQAIPFIEEILLTLPLIDLTQRRPILDFWINNQRTYHQSALEKAKHRKNSDDRITMIILIITIVGYVVAVGFEILVNNNLIVNVDLDGFRVILKIVLGTMSAITLFTGSYYGKLSLSNIIDDHKRMISLYDKVEEDAKNGETEELILYLAREFLIENSTWYSYQSKNKPNINL